MTNKSTACIKGVTDDYIKLEIPLDRLNKELFRNKSRFKKELNIAVSNLVKQHFQIKEVIQNSDGSEQSSLFWQQLIVSPILKETKDKITSYKKTVLILDVPISTLNIMLKRRSFVGIDHSVIFEITKTKSSAVTERIYEILVGYAFRKTFIIKYSEIRKMLGFYSEKNGKVVSNYYKIWGEFNRSVLTPAIKEINKLKDFDVRYEKTRGNDDITFQVISIRESFSSPKIISIEDRFVNKEPNKFQEKYIKTVLNSIYQKVDNELYNYIVFDISQKKFTKNKPFRYWINAIKIQLKNETYTRPFAYKHHNIVFNEEIYNHIKKMYNSNESENVKISQIKKTYTDEVIKINRFGYILNNQVEVIPKPKRNFKVLESLTKQKDMFTNNYDKEIDITTKRRKNDKKKI